MGEEIRIAVAALEAGLRVLSEVPAAVSVEECRRLARAASGGGVNLASNCRRHVAA